MTNFIVGADESTSLTSEHQSTVRPGACSGERYGSSEATNDCTAWKFPSAGVTA